MKNDHTTPETDANAECYQEDGSPLALVREWVHASFARRLERERDEAMNLLLRIARKGEFMDMEGQRLVVSDWLDYRHISLENAEVDHGCKPLISPPCSHSLGKDCVGHEIIPLPGRELVVKTNRHTTTSGYLWGWIEGTTRNTVWRDDCRFNKEAAQKLAREYNANKEDQERKSPASDCSI